MYAKNGMSDGLIIQEQDQRMDSSKNIQNLIRSSEEPEWLTSVFWQNQSPNAIDWQIDSWWLHADPY